jgi:ATP-dependent Clp protease ATP-binding subunit ClpB
MQYVITGSEVLEKNPSFKLVGRANDMKRLTSVLMRSKAASVILVGPGGVGASALLMGLQALKNEDDVPFDIVSKRLFWLKTNELFSSGNNEEINKGFNGVLNILKRTPDSVLIVEDTRDFIEAARNNGCAHFINSLNSLVRNGHTQVILEVRDPDLDMVLASHSDMKQCYTILDLNEPFGDDLVNIVHATAASLEKHHDIKIEADAIDTAIELTNKYRSRDPSLSRAQPERSTNLLDRALSTYRLDAHKRHPQVSYLVAMGVKESDPQIVKLDAEFSAVQSRIKELFKLQRDGEVAIMELEEQIASIKKEEADASARGETLQVEDPAPRRVQMFANVVKAGGFESPAVRDLRQKIRQFELVINENKAEFDVLTEKINNQLSLTKERVLAEFSRLSGIPVSKLNEDEKVKLRNLEAVLNSRVFGQEEVIHKIANAVKVSRIGRRNGGKPQAAFLIMGPSGTGKTEVCKALAQALKDDEAALTRFDMSEYMEKHSVAKLIGAPAGYEGSERGGILTNAMRSNPHRIILFDEIEKADPAVFDLFLQILSDGRLTDNHGRTVNFSESMVIMTTNIGQSFFLDTSLSAEESERLANVELDQIYRPEFLNRFAGRQNIVCFNRLGIESIVKIVKRELNSLKSAYKENKVDVVFSDECIQSFCEDHYDARHGARGLQGYIVANIEPLIVNMILENDVENAKLHLIYNKETKSFDTQIETNIAKGAA